MNYLLISSNYSPEPMGISLYSTDLALNLHENGHRVHVLTTIPYYPWWGTSSKVAYNFPSVGNLDGVEVHRVNLKIPTQPKVFSRLFFEFRMWIKMRLYSKKFAGVNFDQIVAVIPSLGPGLVGSYMSKRVDVPLHIVVQDVSHKGVSQSGMAFSLGLTTITKLIESRVLRSADSIAVISNPIKTIVHSIVNSNCAVTLIPNYLTATARAKQTKADVRSQLRLPQDKFLVIYTGSIGNKQNLINLVNAASLLKDEESIHFVVFGHGNSELELKEKSKEIENFEVRPAVDEEIYFSLLATADLLVVNERSSQVEMALPSKIVSYFSSSTPIVAAVPRGGASYDILVGKAFIASADDPQGLATAIITAKANPSQGKFFAEKALDYFNTNLTRSVGRKLYIDWLLPTQV